MITYNGNYKVYIHTNKVNGKMYIGITSRQNVKNRWMSGHGYKDCPKMWNAISKYGWNNFDHEIFASNLTKEEAQNMQRLLISKLNTVNDGYNIDLGGSTQGKHSEEVIQKCKDCHIEDMKKVLCIEDNLQFESIAAAAKYYNINRSAIRGSCKRYQNGKQKTIRHFKFADNINQNATCSGKKVICIEDGLQFNSGSQAARYYKMASCSVLESCRNYGKVIAKPGKHFKFI